MFDFQDFRGVGVTKSQYCLIFSKSFGAAKTPGLLTRRNATRCQRILGLVEKNQTLLEF
jgi:hypothetical protein